MMKKELFTISPEENQENYEYPLAFIADELDKGEIQIPKFQRPYVWSIDKLIGWANTVISKMAIGVIVTYQIKGGGTKYIADGLQRLTASKRFMMRPEDFGFDFGKEQARQYCKSFKITVQHRIYDSHLTAMIAYQNLNKGTSLTPLEYYAGILKLDSRGKIIYDQIPAIVLSCEKPYVQIPKSGNRQKLSKFTRDSFALFFQYLSKTDQLSFWDAHSSRKQDTAKCLEQLIINYLDQEQITEKKLEQCISSFDSYISEYVAEIAQILKEVGAENKVMSRTVIRWLLHLAIWRKNANREVSMYIDFVKRLLEYLKQFKTITSRFPMPGSDPVEFTTLGVAHLGSLARLCMGLGSNLYEGKRRKNRPSKPGYHHSHIKPFANFGEGETVIEPGPRNRARGAQPIEMEL